MGLGGADGYIGRQKVIPLETPTMVELSSEKSVRVTLFDVSARA